MLGPAAFGARLMLGPAAFGARLAHAGCQPMFVRVTPNFSRSC
jgi:hypothetical protein